MSLVTSCPNCGTVFKVRLEHLTAHRGDVRCGKCGFVFNALEHLAETSTGKEHITAEIPDENQAMPHEQAILEVLQNDQGKAVADAEPITAMNFVIDAVPASSDEAPSEKSGTETQHPNQETIAIPEANHLVAPAAMESAGQGSAQAPFDRPVPQPAISQMFKFNSPSPFASPAHQTPSGLKPAPSPWLLGAFGLTLLALILGQGAYFLRTEIAARYLPSKPYLLKFCELAGCRVDLPQRASLLAIDDSDLQQDAEHEDVIVLSSTLINHASFAQAYPALELTLTDMYDKPLLRRLFTPDEYLSKETDVSAGIAAGGDAHVILHLATTGIKAAGYRVYIMYPSAT